MLAAASGTLQTDLSVSESADAGPVAQALKDSEDKIAMMVLFMF
jgi:hypothetical protein